jgi:hypothetical protein
MTGPEFGLPAEANQKENRSVLAEELPRGPRRFHPGNKEAAGLGASAGNVVNFAILQKHWMVLCRHGTWK